MKKLDVIVAILLVVGGLNWGLVGVFGFDLVATIFGVDPAALGSFSVEGLDRCAGAGVNRVYLNEAITTVSLQFIRRTHSKSNELIPMKEMKT
jgi:hypothetical protein